MTEDNKPEDDKVQKAAATEPLPDARTRRSDRFNHVYANSFRLRQSVFDLSLIFGEIVEQDTADHEAVIEEIAQIVIPRELAKAIARIMTNNIKAYEEAMGTELKVPTKGMLPKLDEALLAQAKKDEGKE
jgi:hypothetical protein